MNISVLSFDSFSFSYLNTLPTANFFSSQNTLWLSAIEVIIVTVEEGLDSIQIE